MKVNITNVLFLDIETVPQYKELKHAPEGMQELWKLKRDKLYPDEELEDSYKNAGLFAEFGKIVCISVGAVYKKGNELYFHVESFYGDDEVAILNDFKDKADKFIGAAVNRTLCGHNGKAFDFPFISRRMVINGIDLPDFLDVAGKKPWEILTLDTMELWKFGDPRYYVSLNTLANIFNIPSPKDDIDGSQVRNVYYNDGDVERIAKYCEKDVITTAKVFCKICQMDDFKDPGLLINAK